MRTILLFVLLSAPTTAQVVVYEAEVFPENLGWERIVFTQIDRFLAHGWFVQFVDFANEVDSYRRSLSGLPEEQAFFLEWRVQTDAPKSVLDLSATPVVVVAGGSSAAFYHTTITDSRVQLFRDTSIPLVFVDIAPDVAHTYRVELTGETLYAWYIDGQVIDSGPPLGSYPNPDSRVTWGTRRQMFDATTRWDYIRFGVMPEDGSGDYDSDAEVALDDFYFFHECLSNRRPGINGGPGMGAGPGCRFADFDFDNDVDLLDVAEFQLNFTRHE